MTNRTRKCKAIKNGSKCGNKFQAKFNLHNWCSDDCAGTLAEAALAKVRKKQKLKMEKAKKEQQKQNRKEHKARKEKLKPISYFHKQAAKSCNAYIRERDKKETCISCERVLAFQEVFHAGHYKPQGSNKAIAYDEANIHGQCIECNLHLSANLTQYRMKLIAKIGLAEVERLESSGQNQMNKTFTREELSEIKEHYEKKLKMLKSMEDLQ